MTMTKEQETYAGLLNLLGSDPEPPSIQRIVDQFHAAAEPEFARHLALSEEVERASKLRFVTAPSQECGCFSSERERDLYYLAVKCWNELQALIKAARAVTP